MGRVAVVTVGIMAVVAVGIMAVAICPVERRTIGVWYVIHPSISTSMIKVPLAPISAPSNTVRFGLPGPDYMTNVVVCVR